MTTTAQKGEKAIYWIEELLTGTYKQKKGMLGTPSTGFCCLGVCKYVNGLKESEVTHLLNTYIEVGLLSPIGRNSIGTHSTCLTGLNDEHKYSLREIGETLREYPELYFEEDVAQYIKEHFEDEE